MNYQNPIIPGFYPDPSICRVGSDYYLVTSSFEFFPGVPIFHSRDLVHWHQIGHCLTQVSQLPLKGEHSSRGIFAPTIRYHDGMFYMVTTNMSFGQHFYVSTDNPAGDWSEPIWINTGGIDPSLFFDNDKVYFTWTNLNAIFQSEIDIKTGQLLTEPRKIWTGTGGRYPEAPHLYKIQDHYCLMIAEGGTEYGHMETIARSDAPFGPFEPSPRNPILTHRNRGNHLIQGTGHADLVEAHDGSWWAVFLGFRCPKEFSNYHHLGRETFLAPVEWDSQGWPMVNGNGTIELEMTAPNLPTATWEPDPVRDDFTDGSLASYWNSLGNLPAECWSLSERQGWLRLNGTALTLDDRGSPAFIGRRQQHFACKAATMVELSSTGEGHEAGLTAYMDRDHHYEIALCYEDSAYQIILRRRIGDLAAVVAKHSISSNKVSLQIQAYPDHYDFAYTLDGNESTLIGSGQTRYLSSEVAGGFTGVYLGMYSTNNETANPSVADFDWFDYTQ
jgi:xylan 1,4-beta-xylosidase